MNDRELGNKNVHGIIIKSFEIFQKFGGPLLGNFRMKSCDNPNIYCDIQVFGQFPFTNVFINSVFAEVSGFHEKQEVWFQFKNTMISRKCYKIEFKKSRNIINILSLSMLKLFIIFFNYLNFLEEDCIFRKPYNFFLILKK